MKRSLSYLAAIALLVTACIAIWHWRFVIEPGALPETRLADPPIGWKSRADHTHKIMEQDGKPVLVLERLNKQDKPAGVHVWFREIEKIQYIHVRCSAKWQDVELGPHTYMKARLVAMMRNFSGVASHPAGGFQVFGGSGSSGWQTYEVVHKLTSDMESYGLYLEMLGNSGRLEVRDLSVNAVRQRAWVPTATIIIVLGWAGLCASLIRRIPKPPSPVRAALGAALLVTAGWILVFPQTKTFLHPLASHFAVGQSTAANEIAKDLPEASALPSPPKTTANNAPTPPRERVIPASPQPQAQTTAAPETHKKTRDSGRLHRFLRQVDQGFGPAHIVLFTGFTLTFLIVTGSKSQWPFPLALALLAEIIPELTDHLGGWDDWLDLASNLAGVGIALLLWSRLPILQRFQARSTNENP